MPRRLFCRVLFVIAVCSAVGVLSAQTGITYVYDELGRLVGVVNAAGEAAIYAYDAVGNLLSITRKTATQVSVIEFTPNKGPSGTTVTIHGTGFSAVIADNTVQFNGTTATVTLASANKLVATVPASATTGQISVTAPNGSATSAESFTVAALGTPTITSFTPSVGAAGVQVTVGGTNFETILANNRVKLGVGRAHVTTAAATSLTTAVPAATGSGKIAVSTPLGQATSALDFYVPPSPYTASDVVFTDRLQYAQSLAVPIVTGTKIGLAVFDATQGQRVSLKVVPGPLSDIRIHKPDGSLMTSRSTGIFTILLEPGAVPTSGTYTVNVDPGSSYTGTTTLTVYDVPADITATIVPSPTGASQSPALNVPGQNATYPFSGTQNQRISLKVNGSAPLGTVSLKNPSGGTMGSASSGALAAFIEPVTLGSTGTHSAFVDPSEAGTGTVTVTVYDVPADLSGPITAGGSAVSAVINTPGQNGVYTFSGTTGQRVSLKVNGSAPLGTVSILNPSGGTLASASSGTLAAFIDTITLGSTGTHTVKVNPGTYNTGTTTVTLYDVPADFSGTITVGGAAVPVTISTEGQNGALTFSGTASQQVLVSLSSNTIGLTTVKLLKPDSTQLASQTSSAASFNLGTQTLPVTGTYTISIDPSQWNKGSITVTVTNP